MQTIPSVTGNSLLDKLRDVVGEAHVLTGDSVSSRASHHWDATPMAALAIVRPANTDETSAVMRICHSAGQAVVTHGGLTGLVEGHTSNGQEIVLSMERQRDIESVDVDGRTITVQAGAVLQSVQAAVADVGLQFGLDLGARGSCTIGGNMSTNAGGLSVLRYGMMREQVLGLEVVLANGTVMSSMNCMMKNNAGYDLKQLFIGSEGTLGIITRAVLRMRAATPAVATALVAFDSYETVPAFLRHMDNALNGTLDAFEIIWRPFFDLNTDPSTDGNIKSPFDSDYPIYAIVESKGSEQDVVTTQFQNALESAFTNELIVDAAVPQSEKERQSIWYIRENVDAGRRFDPAFVYDISLPIVNMQTYLHDVETKARELWPDVQFYAYGHLADGNLHLVVSPPKTGDYTDTLGDEWHRRSNDIVYKPLTALGGSISAEHGIGLKKKPYLALSRNTTEVAMMSALKRVFDPDNILNPGKVVSPG